MNRFRPNIVVAGIDEHEEDYFTNARSGDVALRFVNPCYRCSLTSIDQQSATPGLDVLPTLSTYRYDEAVKGVKFGAYAAISGGVGSQLRVESRSGLAILVRCSRAALAALGRRHGRFHFILPPARMHAI
jgi:uncharacterized protein YcbX